MGLREQAKELKVEYDKTEDDLKALQSVGQIIGEVLRQLDEERCECSAYMCCALAHAQTRGIAIDTHVRSLARPLLPGKHLRPEIWHAVIVKASSGPRYVVGCRAKVDKAKLTPNTRVTLDMTTLTIMRALPREVHSGRCSSASSRMPRCTCSACAIEHSCACCLVWPRRP